MVKRMAADADESVIELPAEPAAHDDDVVLEDEAVADGLPKRAKRNPDGSITLPLLYPRTLKVVRSGETIREERFDDVVMHRLTGADLMAIASSSGEAGLATAFARSTRLNPAIATRLFAKLDGADAADAGAIIGFFCGVGGRTGR